MKLEAFVAAMEEIAPPGLAMAFDNVGLLIGPEKREIRSVLVALDCTVQTAREAAEAGADLLLTHHPLFLDGIKRLLPEDPAAAGAYILIRNGIGLYAAHTNLDAAPGGVNDALAQAVGVEGAMPLPPENLGRIGTLPKPQSLLAFAGAVEQKLNTKARVCGDGNRMIARVAFIGGAGGGDVEAAALAGADVLLTGECKHHQALMAAQLGLCVIEAGHYETEQVVLPHLIKRLQQSANDVQYSLTLSQNAGLRGI